MNGEKIATKTMMKEILLWTEWKEGNKETKRWNEKRLCEKGKRRGIETEPKQNYEIKTKEDEK